MPLTTENIAALNAFKALVESGMPQCDVAAKLGVHQSSVSNTLNMFKGLGIEVKRNRRGPRPVIIDWRLRAGAAA